MVLEILNLWLFGVFFLGQWKYSMIVRVYREGDCLFYGDQGIEGLVTRFSFLKYVNNQVFCFYVFVIFVSLLNQEFIN